MKRLPLTLGLCALALLAACAPQPPGEAGTRGFLWGFWDGAIAPLAFVVSIFEDSVRIYAYPNSGLWYDLGYLIGLTCWAGGSHAARRR